MGNFAADAQAWGGIGPERPCWQSSVVDRSGKSPTEHTRVLVFLEGPRHSIGNWTHQVLEEGALTQFDHDLGGHAWQ